MKIEPNVICDGRKTVIERVRVAFVTTTGKSPIECQEETIAAFVQEGVEDVEDAVCKAILSAWTEELLEAAA